MVVMVSGAVPVFLRVMGWLVLVVLTRWLAKVRLVGVRVTVGAGWLPVPVRGRFCGLSVASSVMLRVAVRVPVVVGLKLVVSVQVVLAASVCGASGQSLVWL